MMCLLIGIGIYLLGIILAYRHIQKSYYHPDGDMYGYSHTIDEVDYMIIFIPIVNLFIGLSDWREESKRKESTFFKPKIPFK